jgi:hypothetical protein
MIECASLPFTFCMIVICPSCEGHLPHTSTVRRKRCVRREGGPARKSQFRSLVTLTVCICARCLQFLLDILSFRRGRDIAVGIAAGCTLDDREVGVRVLVGSRIISTSSGLALMSTQPPTQWVPGAFSPGVKRSAREADYSPPSSDEVKKMWIYTSTPPCVFMA